MEKVVNFKEIECDQCHNWRTKEEFLDLNLGGLCLKCYKEAMNEVEEIKVWINRILP